MGADLDDPVAGVGDFGEDLALVDREGHRLLAIHVLSRAKRRDGDQGVPVVGRDDGYGVDVFAFEQFAEVAILFDALKLRLGDRRSSSRGIDVARRNELDIRSFLDGLGHHEISLAARADRAQDRAVIRPDLLPRSGDSFFVSREHFAAKPNR